VRNAYFDLARKLHPDRLAAIGITDEERHAHRLFAEINTAFAVLVDPARRGDYVSIVRRGGAAAVRAEQARADDLAMRVMGAEESFRRGELALRRDAVAQAVTDFAKAVELQPNEPEYQVMLAWARFAAAPDKAAVANTTRSALLRAAEAGSESPTARYYLGRVERMLGREREALQHFHEALRIRPNHAEAASEARVLEQRLKIRR
jgi:curved DNA-binding protein CbpA